MADERLKWAKSCERKALEARARAETIKDWDARGTMLLIAPMWEALAGRGQAMARIVTPQHAYGSRYVGDNSGPSITFTLLPGTVP